MVHPYTAMPYARDHYDETGSGDDRPYVGSLTIGPVVGMIRSLP